MLGKIITSALIFPIVCFLSFYITYTLINSNDTLGNAIIEQALNTDPNRNIAEQVVNNSVFGLKDDLNIFEPNTYPTNSKRYLVSPTSSVKYITIKKLLISTNEEATGSTSSMLGGGWLDENGNKVFFKSKIDLLTLKSIEPDRDQSIYPLFTNRYATIEIQGPADSAYKIKLNNNFDTIFKGTATINNITKPIWLGAKGNVTEKDFEVKGYSVLKLTDFGIIPPKMSNIFEVEDEFRIEFDIKGLRY